MMGEGRRLATVGGANRLRTGRERGVARGRGDGPCKEESGQRWVRYRGSERAGEPVVDGCVEGLLGSRARWRWAVEGGGSGDARSWQEEGGRVVVNSR